MKALVPKDPGVSWREGGAAEGKAAGTATVGSSETIEGKGADAGATRSPGREAGAAGSSGRPTESKGATASAGDAATPKSEGGEPKGGATATTTAGSSDRSAKSKGTNAEASAGATPGREPMGSTAEGKAASTEVSTGATPKREGGGAKGGATATSSGATTTTNPLFRGNVVVPDGRRVSSDVDGGGVVICEQQAEGAPPDPPPTPPTTDSPGFCVGNTAAGLLLLGIAFLLQGFLFALHCTPIMDVMIDIPDSREWVGVTQQVSVVVGIVLVPSLLLVLVGIARMTCCWKYTQRKAHEADEAQAVLRSTSLVATVFNWTLYATSPASSYFFVVIFAMEVKEFVVQSVALEQLSRAGVGRVAMTLFASLILLNGLAPLSTAWIVRRINRIINGKDDQLRRRKLASRWIARLLFFDATCDLLYSFFGLMHLVWRYSEIYGPSEAVMLDRYDSSGRAVLKNYADHAQLGDASDQKAFMLISEAENALYGGKSAGDITIKLLSRGLPLVRHCCCRKRVSFCACTIPMIARCSARGPTT